MQLKGLRLARQFRHSLLITAFICFRTLFNPYLILLKELSQAYLLLLFDLYFLVGDGLLLDPGALNRRGKVELTGPGGVAADRAVSRLGSRVFRSHRLFVSRELE